MLIIGLFKRLAINNDECAVTILVGGAHPTALGSRLRRDDSFLIFSALG